MEHLDDFSVVIKEGKTIAREEDTVYLEGYVQNHYSVKNFNWQKYRNGEFYHIDVHKSKYRGTTTNLPNPKLVLNDIDAQDGGEYRIEVQRTERVDYSNVYGLMVFPRDVTIPDEESLSTSEREREGSSQIHVCEAANKTKLSSAVCIKRETFVKKGDSICLNGDVNFHHSIQFLKWQKYHNGKFVDINVHNLKYHGTTNILQNPKLVINDVDKDDEVEYRVEVQMNRTKEYSNVGNIIMLSDARKPGIKISSNQKNNRFYIEEDVIIYATFENASAILSVTWQRKKELGCRTLDTTLPKYNGSKFEFDEHFLMRRNCNESDRGTYFLLAACTGNIEVKSNMVFLDIVKDKPTVILQGVSEARYDQLVEYSAIIRSFPKHIGVKWMKDTVNIDITQPKYKRSTEGGDCPSLCINNVRKEDEGVYTIEVHNDLGKETSNCKRLVVLEVRPVVHLSVLEQSNIVSYGQSITLQADITSCLAPSNIQWTRSRDKNEKKEIKEKSGKFVIDNLETSCSKLTIEKFDFSDNGNYSITVSNSVGTVSKDLQLKVEVSQMIIISGPVVVSPSHTIIFHAKMLHQTSSSGKWLKINGSSTQEIVHDGRKYKTKHQKNIRELKIDRADKEDSATYQFALDNMISNKIKTFVDGEIASVQQENCLRLFALQTVSADAMRRVFTDETDFKQKMNNFLTNCKSKKEHKDQTGLSTATKLEDLDITMMYVILRNSNELTSPKKGWGKRPHENDIELADDIERIRYYRNVICHTDALDVKLTNFNESVLDLTGAIRRLSKNNEEVVEEICDVLSRVFTKGEIIEKMIDKLKTFRDQEKKRKKLEILFLQDQLRFNDVCDTCISISDNCKSATNEQPLEKGVCFMKQQLRVGEKVYIRAECQSFLCSILHRQHQINIGLTNENPDEIRGSSNKKNPMGSRFVPAYYRGSSKNNYVFSTVEFQFCISLYPNDIGTILIDFANEQQIYYSYPEIATNLPIWLGFELLGQTKITISDT